jgi:transcriptional regulator with XRE-family HTH domain
MGSTAHDLNRERQWVCARRMAERRHDLGLTQRDVVDRLAELGLETTNRTLSAMEHGQGVDVGRLPGLAAALDCTVTYLLGLTADPRAWAPDDPPAVADVPEPVAVLTRLAHPEDVPCALCAGGFPAEPATRATGDRAAAGPRRA